MLTIGICSECKSEFYKQFSAIEHLCPECASALYGYKNCQHEFANVRCKKCYWNGNSSDYIDQLKSQQ